MNFLGASDPEVERALLRGGKVEAERIRKRNERHAGRAGGSELQELTTSDFRHRILTVLLPQFWVRKADARFLA